MLGAASIVTGWFSGSSAKDEKKTIEMQQKQTQAVNEAAQKQVDDRRQQYNASDVENQNANENVCMNLHFEYCDYSFLGACNWSAGSPTACARR